MKLSERFASAWRAFHGDHWQDPKYISESNQEMAAGAMELIHKRLDGIGIPRGTFADDHVLNLIVLYNWRGAALQRIADGDTKDIGAHGIAREVLEKEAAAKQSWMNQENWQENGKR